MTTTTTFLPKNIIKSTFSEDTKEISKNHHTSKSIQHSPDEILGLPELPPQLKATESPIFKIRVNPGNSGVSKHAPKSWDFLWN